MPTSQRGGVGPPKKKAPPAPISEHSPLMQPRKPKPSTLDKQAAVHAAVHNLPVHVVAKPQPSAPISDVAMESRRQRRLRGPFIPPPAPKATLDSRYNAAIAAPVNAKVKVPGSKKKVPAQDYLAATMTSDELASYANDYARTEATKQAYYNPLTHHAVKQDGGGDTSFWHALTSTPGSVYEHAAPIVEGVSTGLADWLLQGAKLYGQSGASAPMAVGAQASLLPSTEKERHEAGAAFIGRSATNVLMAHHTADPAGALLELAVVPIGANKVLKVSEEVGLALTAARQAGLKRNEVVPVIRAAIARGLESPTTRQSREYTELIGESANNPYLQSAARNSAHEAIDTLMRTRLPVEVQAVKDGLDVQVHLATQGMKPKQAKAYARQAFKEWTQEATDATKGNVDTIKKLVNARIEAIRNPHIAPESPVPPFDEATNADHVRRAVAEAEAAGLKFDANPARLNGIFSSTWQWAVSGRRFRQWYEVSAKAILALVHGDTNDANILAQLMGIYSASAEVPANTIFALRAFDQWKARMPITEGSAEQIKKATQAVDGVEWEGMKTNSFYGNMAKWILPADQYQAIFKDNRPVTVDIWMMRIFGFNKGVPTPKEYEWVANRIREIADQLGWSPEEVQAAAWVAFKAHTEGTSQEIAAFDYAHGIKTHTGQINYETMTDQLKGAIPPEMADQQFQDVMEIIMPGGRDLISEQIGLGAGFHTGPGVENVGGKIVHNPGVASYIPLVRERGVNPETLKRLWDPKDLSAASAYTGASEAQLRKDIKAGLGVTKIAAKYDKGRAVTISEAERQLAREAAAARGFVLDQRAVGTGRVFQPETREEANAVDLRIPGGLSTDTAEKIALFAGPETGVIHTPDGAWLVNFGGEANIEWQARMTRVLGEVDPEKSARAFRVTYDGELVGKDEYENLLAGLERRRPGTGAVLRRLAGDVRATNQRYFDAGAEWRANRLAALAAREGRAAEPADLLGAAGPRGALEGDPLQFAAGFPEERLPPRRIEPQEERPPYAPPEGTEDIYLIDPTPGARVYEMSVGDEVIGRIARDEGGRWIPTPVGRFVAGSEHWVGGEKTLKAAQQRLLTHVYSISPAREDIPAMLHAAKTQEPRERRLRGIEIGERANRGEAAFAKAGGGEAGLYAKKHEYRGEMPSIAYRHFQYFTKEAKDDMINEIEESEVLRPLEKTRAQDAVNNAHLNAKRPTPSDIALLEKVFGKQTTESIVAATDEGSALGRYAVNILGIPRALQTSFDLSFILRQGLVAGTRHPNIARSTFAETIPRARTKAGADALSKELEARPNAPMYHKYKLAITDLGGDWARNEEQYVSRWAEKVPGVGFSSREYTLGLATLRANLFDYLAPKVEQAALEGKGMTFRGRGKERDVDKALRDLAAFINASTGRGNLGHKYLEDAAPLLNQLLFSPRLLASRLAFLNPIWYARLDPAVRKEALSAAMSTLATGMAVLGIAYEAGASVGINPLSSDFGKIKVGNTRIDIWGGFQPIVRYLAQIVMGRYISASTGQEIPLGSGIAKTSRADVWMRFARSKTAPLPSLIWDLSAGKNIAGEDVSLSSWKGRKAVLAREFVPLLWQDMYDYLHEQGVVATQPSTYGRAANARALGGAGTILGLGGLGVGALTFRPRTPARRGRYIAPPSGGLGANLGSNLGGSLGQAP